MKGFSALLLITFWLISLPQVQSQTDVSIVRKSNNKVSLGGKPYYIHIVRQGETLSLISQAYQIPIDSLKADNLHLNEPLKPNQYLKIRIQPQVTLQEPKYVYHTVVKGDTPYNLSARYQQKIEEIYALNPDARMGIKIGQTLKIAIKPAEIHQKTGTDTLTNLSNNLATLDTSAFIYHKVAKQETIYKLTRQYQLKEKVLYEYNPQIKEQGLKEGQWVRIPKTQPQTSPVVQKEQTQKNTTENRVEQNRYSLYRDSLLFKPCPEPGIDKLKTYKVAFFLPLYLNVNDTLGKFVDIITKDGDGNEILETIPRPGKIEDKIYGKSKIFLEFYQGVLLALLDLKKMGINLEVKFIDTQNDSVYLSQKLKKEYLEDYDLFIGPVFGENLNLVGTFAQQHQITIVSPLSLKDDFIEHNPYAFQVAPPFEVQMHHASEFLNSFDSKNYIVIHDGDNMEQEYLSEFKNQLYAQMNATNLNQIKYNEVFYYDAQDSVLKEVFTHGIKNIVVVPSDNQAFVTDIMGKLNGYSYEYDITVFGQPKWMRFDNIDLENYHNTNTHIFSNSFIDYNKPEVIQFVSDFRYFFKTEPDKFSFQAYDITKFFCLALNIYGHDFKNCQHQIKPPLLQTDFNFVPVSNQGGYQNTSIYLLEYTRDFKLRKVATFPEK